MPLLDLSGGASADEAVERSIRRNLASSAPGPWWIKQSIKRTGQSVETIRLPVHLVDKISKMRRVSLQMSEELGRNQRTTNWRNRHCAGKVSQLKTVSLSGFFDADQR
jgi:RNA polymerase primary sigma factor